MESAHEIVAERGRIERALQRYVALKQALQGFIHGQSGAIEKMARDVAEAAAHQANTSAWVSRAQQILDNEPSLSRKKIDELSRLQLELKGYLSKMGSHREALEDKVGIAQESVQMRRVEEHRRRDQADETSRRHNELRRYPSTRR